MGLNNCGLLIRWEYVLKTSCSKLELNSRRFMKVRYPFYFSKAEIVWYSRGPANLNSFCRLKKLPLHYANTALLLETRCYCISDEVSCSHPVSLVA